MPDGSVVDWDYDTVRQLAQAADRGQERQGRDPGGVRPESRSSSGASSPSGTTCAGSAPRGAPGQLPGRRRQGPDPAAPGSTPGSTPTTASGRTTRSCPTPVFQRPEINGRRATRSAPASVAMADQLPVVHVLPGRRRRRLGHRGGARRTTAQTTAAFNADTFRIMKDSKHPDEAFEVLTYLLGDAAPQLLQIYGGMPARPDEQAGLLRRASSHEPTCHAQQTGLAGRRSTASSSPTTPTSSRPCPTTTSRWTSSPSTRTRWTRHARAGHGQGDRRS